MDDLTDDDDTQPGFGEIRGADESVVARADDHHICSHFMERSQRCSYGSAEESLEYEKFDPSSTSA